MKPFKTYIVEFKTFDKYKATIDEFKKKVMDRSLGVPRSKMPQISSDNVSSFKAYLKRDHDVDMKKSSIRVKDIKFTQKELNFDKVAGMIHGAASESLTKPVIISKDGYALDGHHRLAALWIRGDAKSIEAHVVDANIRELLKMAGGFDKVFYKKVSEAYEGYHNHEDE